MKRKQWEWHPRGWFVLLTVGGPWGLGFVVCGLRYNGVDIYFGSVVLTVQPPMSHDLGDAIISARPELKQP